MKQGYALATTLPIVLTALLGAACCPPGRGTVGTGTEVAGPAHAAPELRQTAGAVNAFAFDLHRHLGRQEGNLFFCPLGLGSALAMLEAGAQGPTAGEIAYALYAESSDPSPHRRGLAAMVRQLAPPAGAPYLLDLANALWIQRGYRLRPEYVELVRRQHGAAMEQLDFRAAPEEARRTINDWTARRTGGRIDEMLSPGTLSPDSRLVLTNAVYFKGRWAEPFDPSLTEPGPFHLPSGRAVEVPMMHRTGPFGHAALDEVQLLELPYAGDALAMVILLPPAPAGLKALEQTLTPEQLNMYIAALDKRQVSATIPKFRLISRFELGEALRALGIKAAFSPSEADFGRMTAQDAPPLHLSQAMHQAFVDVGEEGTEAAGATGLVMKPTAAQPEPVRFHADRPFLFLIRHQPTGAILFLGRVTDPTTQSGNP